MNALIFFLQHCVSKLTVLECFWRLLDMSVMKSFWSVCYFACCFLSMILYLKSELRLWRLILSHCLQLVRSVPHSDIANIFPEYVLPSLSWLTQDQEDIVRIAYGENIASLAETALKFLEICSARLCQSREQWRWWLAYTVPGIIIFFKGTGCGWILSFYVELKGQVLIIIVY